MSADRDERGQLVGAVVGAPDRAAPTASWPLLVVGLVLSVALVAGTSLLRGVGAPAAPEVADGDLLVSASSGARYLDLGGRLHPVLNTASARLLGRTGAPRTLVVTDDVLRVLPHGPTLGIPGAPDDLPPAAGVTGVRWTACPVADRVRLSITPLTATAPTTPATTTAVTTTPVTTTPVTTTAVTTTAVTTTPAAATVTVGASGPVTYLLVGGHRLAQAPDAVGALRGALASAPTATPVPAALLDLLPPGAPLDAGSLRLGPGLGAPLTATLRRPGVERVGQLVDVDGSPGLVLADGLLGLDPFAAAVYAATAPSGLGRAAALTAADVAGLPPSSRPDPAPAEWPRSLPRRADGVPCVQLEPGSAGGAAAAPRLVVLPSPAPSAPGATWPGPADVTPGAGSLVRVGPVASDGTVLLVDGTGTAYPVGAPRQEVLSRLGYGDLTLAPVPAAWASLLPRGPTLDPAAAKAPLAAGAGL